MDNDPVRLLPKGAFNPAIHNRRDKSRRKK